MGGGIFFVLFLAPLVGVGIYDLTEMKVFGFFFWELFMMVFFGLWLWLLLDAPRTKVLGLVWFGLAF